ncbi:hypothetical protein O181_098281 [Austropuccinia psidii MF-1]|uniref:Uncharacterized protein n=1 Tax=Austropuccinia psidii MF-1 TaxID=1389203 RepID=A0A9Q3JAK9_9BASI|nr:hypothetical protein [Austropuccinia psidii MF-1]
MSSTGRFYGSGYSDFISSFSPDELEELLFGYPSSPSKNIGIWSWVNDFTSTPSSPPALATLSRSSSPAPSSEGVPKAAAAFYALIKGEYDPRLFVPNPLSYFLGDNTFRNDSIKTNRGYEGTIHPYNLCPATHLVGLLLHASCTRFSFSPFIYLL